jgi:hypothetical protein
VEGAADLIHVIRYSGSIEEVAALFVQAAQKLEGRASGARQRFGDDEHGEGYGKVGAVAYARFHGENDEDEDELVGRQRFAAGL